MQCELLLLSRVRPGEAVREIPAHRNLVRGLEELGGVHTAMQDREDPADLSYRAEYGLAALQIPSGAFRLSSGARFLFWLAYEWPARREENRSDQHLPNLQ